MSTLSPNHHFQPVERDPVWAPTLSFSIFQFGSRVMDVDPKHRPVPYDECVDTKPVVSRYYDEDLNCDIFTVKGLIHKVRCPTVCVYRGFNLVGSLRSRIPEIITEYKINWRFKYEDDPLERVGTNLDLGINLEAPVRTDVIHFVELTGVGPAHRERERVWNAAAQSSNVVQLRQ